jgi:NAD(P)-dependent dehydrogenase (short-subunit alcohol dehydrogenase family)
LDDRTAIVVGTSPNIGAGIAIGLAAAGASVACLDANAEFARACAGEIVDHGGRALGLACDVTDETSAAAAIESATALGEVDILVNGAAIFNHKGIRQMTLAEWRTQTDVILGGAFLMTKLAAESMIAAGRPGSVVNLVSTAGHQGEPGNIAYATSKAGLLNFTRSAATELAPHGIRVNSLTPTSTDPREGNARARRWGLPSIPDDTVAKLDELGGRVPLGRLPSPRHYATAVVYLCSSGAELVTGTDLVVDAGALAMYWRRPTPDTE